MNATEVLVDEHRVIVRALDVLAALARDLDDDGRGADPAVAARLVEFFRRYADAFHHAKEEGHLFPALAEAGLPSDSGPIAVMLAEHDQGRALVARMADAAAGVAASPSLRRDFARAARAYGELLAAHIAKENEVLFRLADQMLDAPTQRRLVEEFARIALASGEGDRWARVVDELARGGRG